VRRRSSAGGQGDLDDCDRDAVLVRVEALGLGYAMRFRELLRRKLDNGEWQIKEARTYDPDAVYGGKQ
jgi:hypothetical protein